MIGEALTARTCRQLQIRQSSAGCLRMAHSTLESLEFDSCQSSNQALAANTIFMGQLTAMTRLELSDFAYSSSDVQSQLVIQNPSLDFTSLRRLDLQELVLLECYNLELGLFDHRAFPSLLRLHIVDSDARQNKISCSPLVTRQLAECGRVVIGMRQLTQPSGSCSLFSWGMRCELASWHSDDYCPGSMTSSSVGTPTGPLQLWRRP